MKVGTKVLRYFFVGLEVESDENNDSDFEIHAFFISKAFFQLNLVFHNLFINWASSAA